MTGDCLICQFDTNQFLGGPFCLLLSQSLLADELCLVELDKHAQTCHNRCDILREFVTIKWQAYFEAERITTTQSASLNASCNQLVPALIDKGMRAIYLEPVLTCVTCTGDDNLGVRCWVLGDGYNLAGVERQFPARQT